MTDTDDGLHLLSLPTGLPLDIFAALMQLVGKAFPPDHAFMSGPPEKYLGEAARMVVRDLTVRQITDALLAAAGADPIDQDDDDDRLSAGMVAGHLTVENGEATIGVGFTEEARTEGREVLHAIAAHFAAMFDATPEAHNYLAWTVHTEAGQPFQLIAVRPGGRLPADLVATDEHPMLTANGPTP